jgi:hypothetical protein
MAAPQSLYLLAQYLELASPRFTVTNIYGVLMQMYSARPVGMESSSLLNFNSCHLAQGFGSVWRNKKRLWKPHISCRDSSKSSERSGVRMTGNIRHRSLSRRRISSGVSCRLSQRLNQHREDSDDNLSRAFESRYCADSLFCLVSGVT